jgi:hypothetical protein
LPPIPPSIDSPSCQRAIQAQLAQGAIGDDEVEIEHQDVWTGEKPPQLETEVMRQEMYACVWNRLEHLPANYRTVLPLSDMEGFTNNEIAEIRGASVPIVIDVRHREECEAGFMRSARHIENGDLPNVDPDLSHNRLLLHCSARSCDGGLFDPAAARL